MAKLGRPRKEIDQEQFEKLCGLQCTKAEIASFFNVSDSTLLRWVEKTYPGETFETIHNKKKEIGKISLRRTQWKLAEKYPSMAIFLGKQILGQTDKIEATVTSIDEDQRKAVEDFLNDEGAGTDIE